MTQDQNQAQNTHQDGNQSSNYSFGGDYSTQNLSGQSINFDDINFGDLDDIEVSVSQETNTAKIKTEKQQTPKIIKNNPVKAVEVNPLKKSEDEETAQEISDLDNSKYDIPKMVKTKYKELASMVLASKSMDDKEKQYWFHILPIMNKKQVDKLRGILENEKRKLAEINQDFSAKMKASQEEKVAKWEAEEHKRKMKLLKEQEKSEEEKEAAAEAELLASLDEI